MLKIITSVPMILLGSYLSILLGILLLLLRLCTREEKKKNLAFLFFLIGILLTLPNSIDTLTGGKILGLRDFVNTDFYRSLSSYGKDLLILAVLLLLLLTFFEGLMRKLETFIRSYIEKEEANSKEIARENDLLIKEKQEKAKNTHVVYCPYCGADNIIEKEYGVCKFCRRKIEYKEKQ